MPPRASLLLSLFALLSGCADSVTSTDASPARDVVIDASPDVSIDASTPACPSPSSVTSGASCEGFAGINCFGASGCFQCGAFSFARYSPSCSCVDGRWACEHVDCGARAGCDSFFDSSCTMPGPCDAGVADVGPVDAVSSDAPSDARPVDGGCVRPDVMVLTTRTPCTGAMMCPSGYECLSASGAVLELFCGRSCRSDCDCPATQVCGSYSDKAGTHPLCVTR